MPTKQELQEQVGKKVDGNSLRAAVLGGNDGLVSNFSLIMGVAGASNSGNEVLIAGTAGLLAGALSMAMGEWISVKSAQEMFENQIHIEEENLKHHPEAEMQKLVEIYKGQGLSEEQATSIATEVMKNSQNAYNIIIQNDLGMDIKELGGSPIRAATSSFVLFCIGAIIPLFPFFFTSGNQAILISGVVSAIGLFVIGALITILTGRNVWYSGFRQMLFGVGAAFVSYWIGTLFGVTVL